MDTMTNYVVLATSASKQLHVGFVRAIDEVSAGDYAQQQFLQQGISDASIVGMLSENDVNDIQAALSTWKKMIGQ